MLNACMASRMSCTAEGLALKCLFIESWEQCSDNGDLLVCAILKLQSITSTFHSDCRHTNVDHTVLTMCVLTVCRR